MADNDVFWNIAGPTLLAIFVTVAIVMMVLWLCGVFNPSNGPLMYAGGAGVGDFFQFQFLQNLSTQNSANFKWQDLSNNASGGALMNGSGGTQIGQSTFSTISQSTFFNPAAMINIVQATGPPLGIVCSTPYGGTGSDTPTLIVGYAATGLNFNNTFPLGSPQVFNFMQFKTHVGGWQWGWTSFVSTGAVGTGSPSVTFTEQTVWPFVEYYQMWNGTGALGYTGTVVTPNYPETMLFTNYTNSTQPYYTTQYVLDPHVGPAYLFTNQNNNLALDLPDGFILYSRQSSNSLLAIIDQLGSEWYGLSYMKSNVVTTPVVPSVETGNIVFGQTIIDLNPNNLFLTLSVKSQGFSIAFSTPMQPISASPWVGDGLTNNCPGMFYVRQVINNVQYTCVIMLSGLWISYGLTQMPFTSSPEDLNPAYFYMYGSGSHA
jgi:hypothetical protein